jgi:hypothetical protein
VNNFNDFTRLVVPIIILTISSASNKKAKSPELGKQGLSSKNEYSTIFDFVTKKTVFLLGHKTLKEY